MTKIIVVILAFVFLLPTSQGNDARAGWSKSKGQYSGGRSVQRGPQVRGYTARRGGYSYSKNDVANTGSDSRTRFGSNNAFRDQFLDRQTIAGPFDHGWFFDSAIAPRGGDAPYMQ